LSPAAVVEEPGERTGGIGFVRDDDDVQGSTDGRFRGAVATEPGPAFSPPDVVLIAVVRPVGTGTGMDDWMAVLDLKL
jgi:hypothetical protein